MSGGGGGGISVGDGGRGRDCGGSGGGTVAMKTLAATNTMAATAMVGDIDNNQLKLAAEEMLMVMATEKTMTTMTTIMMNAEICGDPYSKKSPLPSTGNFPCLANFPKLSSYQVFG
jgi:hypothetical protein